MKEPIAIIGLGCRFPGGANNPQEFWRLIGQKYDAISEVPQDRWNLDRFYSADASVTGTIQTRFGGFLEQIDQFDAEFFGISPREASAMDPQQRLLLEVVWEALEDAGEVPEELRGSRTGVYIGFFAMDYILTCYSEMQKDLIGSHTSIGACATLLSNRISHFFDFQGPSMSLDTACSSSMVAVHLACRSLWEGETDMAVAGGTNIIFKPEWTIATSKGGFLSPDGRCKVFDTSANGYVRSEGVGSILLKPLSKALEAGNRVYAVIRETGSNQDGKTSSVTVPSMNSQKTMMEGVYDRSGIAPADVYYVEAHGTGTPTGDPIETGAIGAVFSVGREQDTPCLIGSVKSNIGHMEAASGMGGIIKAALSLHHQEIPPNIHFNTVNADIHLDDWKLKVVTQTEAFPAAGSPRYVGVNSFGFGGTNVHVVLQGAESYCPEGPSTNLAEGPHIVAVSARSKAALQESVAGMLAFVGASDATLGNIASNAARHRQHHPVRASFIASSKEHLKEQFESRLEAPPSAPTARAKIAFVFSGMGPQWWAMGRGLLESEPLFAEKIKQCDALLGKHADWSLVQELSAPEESSRIGETRIAQPAIFAIQVAMAALLESWGIKPVAIIGHSAGEVAAAHVAGVLSLEDAVLVIYHRSRLQHQTEGQGRILAAGLSAQASGKYLEGRQNEVSLGAINSPNSIALAGDETALEAIATELTANDIFCKMLYGKVPYHSPKMDPLKDELVSSLQGLTPRPATIAFYSTVTGGLCEGSELTADYWFKNIRNTVMFAPTIASMIEDDILTFAELSAHPVLSNSIGECLEAVDVPGQSVPTLRRDQDDKSQMLSAVGKLYEGGATVLWQELYPESGNLLSLPHYPWQRDRYWVESEQSSQYRLGQGGVKNFSGQSLHPLLGGRLQTGAPLWDVDIDLAALPFLEDHKVGGAVVYPGAAYVEAAIAAARQTDDAAGHRVSLSDLKFNAALTLAPGEKSSVQLSLDPGEGTFKIFGRTGKQPWLHHASGAIDKRASAGDAPKVSLADMAKRCPEEVDVADLYRSFTARGLQYGPAFRGIDQYHRGEATAFARLTLADDVSAEGYHLHPCLLDAGFQAVLGILTDEAAQDLMLPIRIDAVRINAVLPRQLFFFAELVEQSAQGITSNISLYDDAGQLVVALSGLRCKAVGETPSTALQDFAQDIYAYGWESRDLNAPSDPAKGLDRWLVFTGQGGPGHGELIARTLEEKGRDVVIVAGTDISEQTLTDLSEEPASTTWGVVFCTSGFDSAASEAGVEQITHYRDDNEIRLLQVLQALSVHQLQPAQICLVSEALIDHDSDTPVSVSPSAAAFWAMGRVLVNEYPNISCVLANIDGAASVPALVTALDGGTGVDGEDEISFQNGQCHVHRLRRADVDALASQPADRTEKGGPYQLVGRAGAGGVRAVSIERQAPTNGQVELEVHGAALLAADVHETELGRECSGVISDVGAGVSHLKVGDQVIALATGCCRSHVSIDARLVVAKPSALTMDQAASVAYPFVCAGYALQACANIGEGQWVLLFDDDRQVGAAALQVARRAGARVVMLDGTSDQLAGDLVAATDGQGFDVIFDTSPNRQLANIRAVLAPLGRLVELAAEAGDPGNANVHNHACFRIDVSALCSQAPARVAALLADLYDGFEGAQFLPAPVLSVPASKVLEDRQPGKLVALMRDEDIQPVRPRQVFKAKPQATYLVTGGVRGFGLSSAQWLASKGARYLVLLGRSAALSPQSEEAIVEMRRAGVDVRTVSADVADPEAMAEVFENMAKDGPPLAGIIHAANVYDDDYLAQMSEDAFRRVFDPKALGAWNLHRLSLSTPLDFFVMYGSISATLGNPGQGNYVAANGFLSGLSGLRKARGLTVLTVNWGAIADVGFLARNAEVEAQLKETGIHPLDPDAALDLLGELIINEQGEVSVARVQWSAWRGATGTGKSPRLGELSSGDDDGQGGQGQHYPLLEILQGTPLKKRRQVIEVQLLVQSAAILGMSKSKLLGATQGFAELGMDSVLSVELRNRLQKNYGCSLPATLIFLYPNVEKLAAYFLEEALVESLSKAADEKAMPADEDEAQNDMSIDDMAAMLERKLSS